MLDQCSSHWSVSPDTCLTEVPPGEYSLMSRRLIFLLILLSSLLFLLLLSIIKAPIPIQYFFHPDCPCHRLWPPTPPPAPPPPISERWIPPMGSFVGQSTCNSYTSAFGAGQRVLSYTYYTPWQVFLGNADTYHIHVNLVHLCERQQRRDTALEGLHLTQWLGSR